MHAFLDELTVPTLLLDEAKCRGNLQRMADRAARHGLQLRPHAKTHQSRQVARWMRDYGIEGLTVSSLRMARYFADDGWTDITVAFPTNLREQKLIRSLSSRIRLNLLAESMHTLQALEDLLSSPVGIFIKADTGYGRTGLRPGQWELLDPMIAFLQKAGKLEFQGFLCHAGHAYGARRHEEIEQVHRASLAAMDRLRRRYASAFPQCIASIGDSPTCSVVEHFEGIGEMRPGNFVFYDLDQVRIGSCRMEDIALAMACPVVAKHPDRQDVVLYGGGVHFSTERQTLEDGNRLFGRVVRWANGGWTTESSPAHLWKLSQEHGLARYQDAEAFAAVEVGDLLPVLPVHACMTADAMGSYRSLKGQRISMMEKNPG